MLLPVAGSKMTIVSVQKQNPQRHEGAAQRKPFVMCSVAISSVSC